MILFLGLESGDVIRLLHQGNFVKGRAGNLFVQVNVVPSSLFTRKGCDIYSKLEISLTEALDGASKSVMSIHGPLNVAIPKNIQPGHTLRLRGQGIRSSKTGQLGDHYLQIDVRLPQLSSEQISRLKEILGQPQFK